MLNENIYNMRKRQGLSQEALAEKADVSRQTISNWETGQTAPNPGQLITLAQTFGITVDQLLGNEVKPTAKFSPNPNIIKGCKVVCAILFYLWAVYANRFHYSGIMFITILGWFAGYGIGLVINGISENIGKKE